eukprot:Platyproteum_vivax@DN6255_c0_g1_i1.p1
MAGNPSKVAAVLGGQWGDEGKGKLVDILAEKAHVTARFNGGSNAGHTLIVNGKKFAFHLLPCGILYPQTINVIGAGVVLHIPTLLKELENLKSEDENAITRLRIDGRCHLVFDVHQIADGLLEAEKQSGGGDQIGTTKRGIGPTYMTKAQRSGIRAGDLLEFDLFEKKFQNLVGDFQKRFTFEYDVEAELKLYRDYAEKLGPYIVDGQYLLQSELDLGKNVLLEGANACMLDLDWGTYPFVTSSSCCAGGMCTGAG